VVLFCWEGLWFVIDVRVPELAYEREREEIQGFSLRLIR